MLDSAPAAVAVVSAGSEVWADGSLKFYDDYGAFTVSALAAAQGMLHVGDKFYADMSIRYSIGKIIRNSGNDSGGATVQRPATTVALSYLFPDGADVLHGPRLGVGALGTYWKRDSSATKSSHYYAAVFDLTYTRFTTGGGLYGAIGLQVGVPVEGARAAIVGMVGMIGYAFSSSVGSPTR